MNKFFKTGVVVAALAMAAPVAGTATIGNVQTVQAKSWGNLGVYNLPKKMHGTWISNDKKSVYKKIQIGKGTIHLYRNYHRPEKSIYGKWKLRRQSTEWMRKSSMRTRINSFQYARKNKYMAVRKFHNDYVFGFGWGVDCNDADFVLMSKNASTLKFTSVIRESTFHKAK